MLYHRVLSPALDELQTDDRSYNYEQASTKYLHGEYKLINQLCGLLDRGQEAKRLADICIDACAHMQNLREAIYDYKLKLASSHSHEIEARGLNYLLRYFYLVVFAEYLLEELDRATGKFGKTFLHWLAERREITNLTQKSILSFD